MDTNPKNPTVLIIEDDQALAKMYSTKFQMEGFNSIVAKDGKSGMDFLNTKSPDAILLDIMLPGYSGLDLLSSLQSNPKAKNTVILALTNHPQKESAQKALNLGVKEYLVKAMQTPEEVVEKVKKYLNLPQ